MSAFCLENDNFDIGSVQDSKFEDMTSCLTLKFDKSSEFQEMWSLLLEGLSYVVKTIPTHITTAPRVTTSKTWKAEQVLYDVSNCNPPYKDNNDNIVSVGVVI